ncbi:MAG TPA: FtsX-like permease family protein [Candidatus Saccharimonadaceae bacterium]|nr:FtsX-like permease family protein [Candidatus Saccharimonadaceae bacterium]
MNLPLWIAGRYLARRRQSAFITLLTWISVGGVALGVTALLTVLAVMNGFESEIQGRITGTDAHVVLLADGDRGLADAGALAARVRRFAGVSGVARFTYQKAMVYHAGVTEGLVVKGIDLAAERGVTTVADHITPALDSIPLRAPGGHPGIVLGSELAARLGARAGDEVVLGSLSGASMSALGFAPRLRTFDVVGVFSSGLYTYDSSLGFTAIPAAQEFFGMGDVVTGIEVKLADMMSAPRAAERMLAQLADPRLRANNWMDLNRNLFTWMRLEKTVMFVILALIVLVAAFNIVSTLFMVVSEKRRDIGVLMSLGATRATVLRIFLLEGLLIGGIGTLLGTALGSLLIALLARYPLIRLPGDVYFIERLPVRPETGDFVTVVAAALALCLAAGLYPAWQASRLDPVEAIRANG